MQLFLSIFSFIFGLFFGSFLNVVIDRFPKKRSIIFGRSCCTFCKKKLQWYDLMPVLSYVFLLGHCRYCKKFIGFRYPIIELLTGFSFFASFYLAIHTSSLFTYQIIAFLYYVFVFSCLLCIFFIDLWHEIIPDFFVFPLVIVSFFYTFFLQIPFLFNALLSAAVCAGFFLFLYLITKKRGMGKGDIKLSFFIGLLLGWPNAFLALYIAFLTGAFVSLILIIWGKRKLMGGVIPFGPFLVLGTVIALLLGNEIWQQILHFLF